MFIKECDFFVDFVDTEEEAVNQCHNVVYGLYSEHGVRDFIFRLLDGRPFRIRYNGTQRTWIGYFLNNEEARVRFSALTVSEALWGVINHMARINSITESQIEPIC